MTSTCCLLAWSTRSALTWSEAASFFTLIPFSASWRLLRPRNRAQFVFDFHQRANGLREAELQGTGKAIGTTGKGIGPTCSTKAIRSGLRVHHLVSDVSGAWEENYRRMLETEQKRFGGFEYDAELELSRMKKCREADWSMVVDSVAFIYKALAPGSKKKVFIEGANALMLDIGFDTYPFVPISNTGIGGACTGFGVPPAKIGEVIGIVKAYIDILQYKHTFDACPCP